MRRRSVRLGLLAGVVVGIAVVTTGVLVWLVSSHPENVHTQPISRVARRPGHLTTTSKPLASKPGTSSPGAGTVLATSATQLTFTDRVTPLVSGGVTLAPTTVLPTTVIRPTTPGRYPLVVFIHGFDVGPATYVRFLTMLASHGYVVAAPSFPLEDPSLGYPLSEDGLPAEAVDVSFVITALEQSPEAAHLAPGKIAVVGHSDGADVSLLVGYGQATSDPRVKAVVSDAPDPMDTPTINGGAPLLLVHGSADQIVNPASAGVVMGQVHAERWSLTLAGANHAAPIIGPSPWTQTFDSAVVQFLASVLHGGSPAALSAQLSSLPAVLVVFAGGP